MAIIGGVALPSTAWQGRNTVSLSAAGLSLPKEQFEPDGFRSVCQAMT